MKMKDLDLMPVEKIIRLPFFVSLEKDNDRTLNNSFYWKIKFKCNRVVDDKWCLLDQIFDNEFVIRFKLIDPNY